MKAIKVWITFHRPTFWSTNCDYNLKQRQSCKKCVSKSTAATSSRKVFKKSLGFNKGKKKISSLLLIKYYLCFKGEAGKEYRLVAECPDQALSSVPNTKIQESMNSIWMFSNWLVDNLHFKVSSFWCYVFVCLCLFTWVQYPWSLEGILRLPKVRNSMVDAGNRIPVLCMNLHPSAKAVGSLPWDGSLVS